VQRLRIAVADDHGIVREGVKSMVARCPDLDWAGEAADSRQAIEVIERTAVDVFLIDYRLCGDNGFDLCTRIKTLRPETVVVMFTAFGNAELLAQAIRAGASGYVLKDTSTQRLPEILRALSETGTYFDPRLAGQALLASVGRGAERPSDPGLGERDAAILRMIAQGMSNVEIAGELYLSPHTVKFHVTKLLRKCGMRRRSELAGIAHELFLTG
jgi:DNA-binding NarL/FixJ family response regulator